MAAETAPDTPLDERSFTQLFERHAVALALFVRRRGGNMLRADFGVEDVLQVVAWKAWTRRSEFRDRGAGSFHRWLLQIAHHVLGNRVHYLRAKQRGRALPLASTDQPTAAELALVDRMTTITTRLTRKERVERVHRAILGLPAAQREVVELAFVEGASLREVAARLGIGTTTAFDRLHRAMAALRDDVERAPSAAPEPPPQAGP